jgi:iron complex outermembrane receptor protein
LGGAALAGGFLLAGPATAQDQVTEVDEAEELEEVIVTGSRLARSGFDSPTPIDVVDVQEAVELGYSDLNEMLIATPALAASDQMTDVLSGILGNVNGGQGVATINLRGLGAEKTLSLLNGRRAGPAGIRDGVTSFDVNVIPVAALERVEILKDGASSIYGSDAIGGVVNYITRKDTGGEVNAYTQMAEESGGEIYQVNASYGREFDRGY